MYARNTLGSTPSMASSKRTGANPPPPAPDPATAAEPSGSGAARVGRADGPRPGAPILNGSARHNGRGPDATDAAIDTVADNSFYLRFGKRALDVVVAALALAILLPLFVIIAVVIRLDSPGPVLYRCTRVGRGGVPFTFWKFRSMANGADCDKSKLLHLNEVDGPVFKLSRDPRMTRVGRWLRRTSIDELPQLVHVLVGHMTLVGPRPPEPEEVVQYEPWQRRRLAVRPGLTCLWQISGRSLIGFEEWMRLDLEYVSRRSFALDLRILLRTIPAVISGRGAF